MPHKMMTRRTIKGFRGLGQEIICSSGGYADPITGLCPGDSGPTGGDTSGFDWNSFFADLLKYGSQTAVAVTQAENQMYRTPYGSYPYGAGPYPQMTYTQAQQAALRYQGSTGLSSNSIMIIALVGVGLMMVMMMRR